MSFYQGLLDVLRHLLRLLQDLQCDDTGVDGVNGGASINETP